MKNHTYDEVLQSGVESHVEVRLDTGLDTKLQKDTGLDTNLQKDTTFEILSRVMSHLEIRKKYLRTPRVTKKC